MRFPGSFGSAYLYYVVPKVILFRVEHSRSTLVPKVDSSIEQAAVGDQRKSGRRCERHFRGCRLARCRQAASKHCRVGGCFLWSFTDQEDETMSLLDGKKHDRTLAQSEALLFNLLLEKRTKKDQCETALIYRHLQRLPPP